MLAFWGVGPKDMIDNKAGAVPVQVEASEPRDVWEAPYVVSSAVKATGKPGHRYETDTSPTVGPS